MVYTWKHAPHLEKCGTLKKCGTLGKMRTLKKKRHTWINAPHLVDKLAINHMFKTLGVPLVLVSLYWLLDNF